MLDVIDLEIQLFRETQFSINDIPGEEEIIRTVNTALI